MPEEMAEDFIKADVKGILMGWDAENASGLPRLSNDSLADIVKRFPQAFIGGFAGVDPWKGEMALKETERAVKELQKTRNGPGQKSPNSREWLF